LVRANGGEISVESENGHGSTFTVRVPMVGAPA
jgi:signal transduction histidine kinase